MIWNCYTAADLVVLLLGEFQRLQNTTFSAQSVFCEAVLVYAINQPHRMRVFEQSGLSSQATGPVHVCVCFDITIMLQLFSGLVFLFAIIWVQNPQDPAAIETFFGKVTTIGFGPSIWVLFAALLSLCITVILFLCLICCVVWLVKKSGKWFCFVSKNIILDNIFTKHLVLL